MRAMQTESKYRGHPESAIADLDSHRYAKWTQRRFRFMLAAGIRADLEHVEPGRWVTYFLSGVSPEEAAMSELGVMD